MDEKQQIKSYVIRASRMSRGQKAALENYAEKYCINFQEKDFDMESVFSDGPLCIEIGFGMGTATSAIAEKNPENNYIGIEVHKPGVGRLLADIENKNLSNLKIINHDAVEVLSKMIKDSSIDGFHILFPDPWPKTKHHKRRLINDEFTDLLVCKLKPGGYIYTATDWENYALQMLDVFNRCDKLENSFTDWADAPVWRPQTAFERKGLNKNHIIRELYYKCVK